MMWLHSRPVEHVESRGHVTLVFESRGCCIRRAVLLSRVITLCLSVCAEQPARFGSAAAFVSSGETIVLR